MASVQVWLSVRRDLFAILTGPRHQPDWLVDGFLLRGSFVILSGEPGAGKSVLSLYLAMCLAGGLPFLIFKERDPIRVL